MCRRIFQLLLIAVAILAVASVFVPWTRLFFMSSETATRCLLVRVLALPVFGVCLFGSTLLADSTRRHVRRAFGKS